MTMYLNVSDYEAVVNFFNLLIGFSPCLRQNKPTNLLVGY